MMNRRQFLKASMLCWRPVCLSCIGLSIKEVFPFVKIWKENTTQPLDCKEIQPVHSEGDQSWVFFGRTDAEAETPVLWPPHAKSWLTGKDPDAGRHWGQEEKGTTKDEIDGWMASLTRWTWVWVNSGSWWWTLRPGVLWLMGGKESDKTEWLNWTELTLETLFTMISTLISQLSKSTLP